VVRFSYAGGRVPDPTDGFGDLPSSDYGAPATQTDVRAVGARLADLIEAVAAEAPGAPVDLYAHSLGGVVVRLALIELEARHGAVWLERLGLVATLGSPHGGADLATAVHAVSATRSGDRVLDAFSVTTHQELDDDAPVVAQLSETSAVVADLRTHPVPASVDAVSIAARGDLIVPVPHTVAPGMEEVVVPIDGLSAHTELPASPEATRELGLALAGLPPTCQELGQALLGEVYGEAVSLGEDAVGAVGLVAGLRADVRSG
jgi:alpha-beta hydrolase superfamily lysophospholipase